MRYLITGAGQIGRQLVHDLAAQGDTAVVLRRSPAAVAPDAGVASVAKDIGVAQDIAVARDARVETVQGDAGDSDTLRGLVTGCDAVLHCIHAAYDSRVWRRELPWREEAVMDVAADAGVPVVFPESVYAFGRQALDLAEGAAPDPVSPLGEVRAELLAARAAHVARTVSVVAADLVGPTATRAGSVATGTVVAPVARGSRAYVLADPRAPHGLTHLPDLTRAMRHAAEHARELAPSGDVVLHAPTPSARSLLQLALDVARMAGLRPPRVTGIPAWLLRAVAPAHPMLRELQDMAYLWREPMELRPGRLTTVAGLEPTAWADVVAGALASVRGAVA